MVVEQEDPAGLYTSGRQYEVLYGDSATAPPEVTDLDLRHASGFPEVDAQQVRVVQNGDLSLQGPLMKFEKVGLRRPFAIVIVD